MAPATDSETTPPATASSAPEVGDVSQESARLHTANAAIASATDALHAMVTHVHARGMSWRLVSEMIPGWEIGIDLEGQGSVLDDAIQGLTLTMKPMRNVSLAGFEDGSEDLVAPMTGSRPLDMDIDPVAVAGVAVSFGILAWAARSSMLLASLLVSTPAWRSLDMLPVLGGSKGNTAAHAEEEVSSRASSATQRRDQTVEELS
ncbi:MAG: hypothetical protein JSR14_01030 [Proteobacteria bacterium]|nr:hypothetical protein [Pseudomonadota bacterium]